MMQVNVGVRKVAITWILKELHIYGGERLEGEDKEEGVSLNKIIASRWKM